MQYAAAPANDTKPWHATIRHYVSNPRNGVMISTDGATYAIDRTTHAQVWSVPFGGKLALSANGILYINSLSSILAVNLK